MSASQFGLMLRQLRKDRRVTLAEVADATGVSVPMLSRMERGERLPSSDTLRALADYYRVSPHLLVGAVSAQHAARRYQDSWDDDVVPGGLSAISPHLMQRSASEPGPVDEQLNSLMSPGPTFRAQPISALFAPETDSAADAVNDATVASEAALKQLAREVRRSAAALGEDDRQRLRERLGQLRELLETLETGV